MVVEDEENKEGTVPVVIRKYANRRLYNVESSTYATLEDLAGLVRDGREFVVRDVASGEDITHAVLVQIIFDQESKGQGLLPTGFLLQLIRMYEGSVRNFVPSYLEMCLESLVREQERFSHSFIAWSGLSLEAMRDQVKRNLSIFGRAISSVSPVTASGKEGGSGPVGQKQELRGDLEALERQVEALRSKIDSLSRKVES